MASSALQIGFIGEEVSCYVRQGATFGMFTAILQNPDGTAVDLTGATINAAVKKTSKDLTPKATFNVTFDANRTTGIFHFGLTAAQTALLTAGDSIKDDASKYVWDMYLQTGAQVTPLYFGAFSVFRRIAP